MIMTSRTLHLRMALLLLGACLALWSSAPPLQAFAASGSVETPTSIAAFLAPLQEESSQEATATEHAESEAAEHSVLDEIFHWANFLILLGGVWFLIRKFLVPFLEERGRMIRENMDRSAKALAEADQRMTAVEAKLRSLGSEMAALRQAALQESAAEQARIEAMAQADSDKILSTAEQEIEAAVKAARQELKAYTAELALGVAEKKIRDSLTPQAEERILRSFFQELAGNGTPASRSGDGTPSQRKEG